jgi:hypothetical protein
MAVSLSGKEDIPDTYTPSGSISATTLAGAIAELDAEKLGRSEAISTDYVSVGTNPATVGIVRVPNNQFMVSRNAANTADVYILGLNATNQIQLGSAGTAMKIGTAATDTIGFWGTAPVARNTGWNAQVGYSVLKNFNPATATLSEALRVLATLVDAFKTNGLLGG